MKLIKKCVVLCLPCVLFACTSIPLPKKEPTVPASTLPSIEDLTPSSSPQVIEEPQLPIKIAPVDDAVKANPAVLSLLERADRQRADGNEQAAAASLERAIRIAPRYPESYYRLGEVRYSEARYSQAKSLAEKALSLGADLKLRTLINGLIERTNSLK